MKRSLRHPRLWAAFVVYSAAYLVTKVEVARLRGSGKPIGWRRDDASRTIAR
jgi:hypothetical protein